MFACLWSLNTTLTTLTSWDMDTSNSTVTGSDTFSTGRMNWLYLLNNLRNNLSSALDEKLPGERETCLDHIQMNYLVYHHLSFIWNWNKCNFFQLNTLKFHFSYQAPNATVATHWNTKGNFNCDTCFAQLVSLERKKRTQQHMPTIWCPKEKHEQRLCCSGTMQET